MAVSSTTGGLRTGVCLSTDRPQNPYHGQVVYETDTKRTLVWDNSAWVVVADASATGFPTSLDTNSVGAIEALQAKVGVDGSTATTSLDYKLNTLSYQYVQTLYFTTVGTATFTKATYPWLRAVRVMAQGGGGGGGGAVATGVGEASFGSGGGGGGYAEAFLLASALGSSETVTVAGPGGSSFGTGGTGGTSSFGSLVSATGGSGGQARSASAALFSIAAGVGGSGTGDLIVPGTPGFQGIASGQLGISGAGGSSHLGAGGLAPTPSVTSGQRIIGNAGQSYGGGGSGALNSASAAATASGAGAQGIVIVELYA